MKKSASRLTYRKAGVDIAGADAFVHFALAASRRTHGKSVVPHRLGYSGLVRAGNQLLAATCDGVGTKLLVARAAGQFEGLGQDLVAMSVNDLLPVGATPLFFLDYIAVGALQRRMMDPLLQSIVRACRESGCALLGGETAEMPGVYAPGHFDLAGFAVGLVEGGRLPKPESMRAGDVVLGLPSTGLHSNGFSLARKALLGRGRYRLSTRVPDLGTTLAEALLVPTALYPKPVLALHRAHGFRAAAHVTGGGLWGRARKLATKGLGLRLDMAALSPSPLFGLIARAGHIRTDEMLRTFNMGAGFIAVVSPKAAAWALKARLGFRALGTVEQSKRPLVVEGM